MHRQLLVLWEESNLLVTYSVGDLGLVLEEAMEPYLGMVEGDAALAMVAMQPAHCTDLVSLVWVVPQGITLTVPIAEVWVEGPMALQGLPQVVVEGGCEGCHPG